VTVREYVFQIDAEPGADDYVDAFRAERSLHAEALYVPLDETRLWRLERVEGDPAALSVLQPVLLDEETDRESVGERRCDADRTHSLLTDRARQRVVFTHFDGVEQCDTVPSLAARYTSGGLFLRHTQRGATAEWRVFLQDDQKVGLLYDTLTGRLADDRTFSFERFCEVESFQPGLLGTEDLPTEQYETLALAADRGYFETPREVTVGELAEELDEPRSTVSYRLRRAVAAVVKRFLDA
jgi:predicted DNA binding protein